MINSGKGVETKKWNLIGIRHVLYFIAFMCNKLLSCILKLSVLAHLDCIIKLQCKLFAHSSWCQHVHLQCKLSPRTQTTELSLYHSVVGRARSAIQSFKRALISFLRASFHAQPMFQRPYHLSKTLPSYLHFTPYPSFKDLTFKDLTFNWASEFHSMNMKKP